MLSLLLDDDRFAARFTIATDPGYLPSSRRSGYLAVRSMDNPDRKIKRSKIFQKWTEEGEGSCYREINRALLADDRDTLMKHVDYINSLRTAMKKKLTWETMKVYRGLQIDSGIVRSIYKDGALFLWPTFSSTSRDKDIAHGFGNYLFEITATNDDYTYRTDISSYSEFPHEQEVLFYPYSGFRVKQIIPDAKVVQLECVDTLKVEKQQESKENISNCKSQ